MQDDIIEIRSPAQYEAFGVLVREYTDWCRERFKDDRGFIEATFGHQSLHDELESIASVYGPPKGRAFLAYRDGVPVGCGALKWLDKSVAELKRVFVPERFRGRRTGRRLCQTIIAAATADGATAICLDTGYNFHEAIALYRALGFADCAPYHDYPAALLPYLRFMELKRAPR